MEKAGQKSFTLGLRHAGKRTHFNYFNLCFVSRVSEKKKKISEKYLGITCTTEFYDFNFPQRQKENLEG